MTEFGNFQKKLEEKFLRNKVRKIWEEKKSKKDKKGFFEYIKEREKYLEDYATVNYLLETLTPADVLESRFYGENFSIN
ncbi:MAG: hypothetical protein M1416_01315 [Candidatus Pacearchaeota archaeon]|nr:hypothetical protein [Candidatus Pacearchaeota archaeon]